MGFTGTGLLFEEPNPTDSKYEATRTGWVRVDVTVDRNCKKREGRVLLKIETKITRGDTDGVGEVMLQVK